MPNGRAIAKTFLVDKSSKYTLNQRIAGITPHSNINPKFLSITLNRNKYFLQFDDGVKQTNLSLNDMKKFEEFYPNKQEQDKIGELFTNLDNLITLHQRKFNYILSHKLEIKLFFFIITKNVWEQRKLGDVSFFKQGSQVDLDKQYSDLNENRVRFIRIVDYTQNTDDIRYIDKELSNNIINEKDVVIVRYGATAGFVGHGITGVLANNMFTVNPENDVAKDYLYIYLKQDKIYKKLNNSNGSSAMPALNFGTVKDVEIAYPLVAEQDKIGELFTNLDNLITLHQRKCTYIFYSWEQRKFENIFNYERPDKYIVNSTEYLEFGPTPVLTANKAFILGYTTEKNKYVNSHESIIFDDFTLDTKFVDFPYMVKSSAIKILTLKDEKKDNIRFNFELLSNHRFNMLGHARHYISVVQPEKVFTTNKQEQNKIGDLFTNIDNLITLHQHKELKRRNDNNDNLRW